MLVLVTTVFETYIAVSAVFVRGWRNFKFALQILLGKLNIKFHDDPSSGSRVVPCEWTDGQTKLLWLLWTL